MLLAFTVASGCQFYARSPEDYRDATQALLDTKTPAIKACYDAQLNTAKDTAGKVTVHFKVEKETGKLVDIAADPARTQAPEALTKCVVDSLQGLALTPPDKRDGDATFEYVFSPSGAAAPAEPAASTPPAAAPAS
jgi:hypothetical protein